MSIAGSDEEDKILNAIMDAAEEEYENQKLISSLETAEAEHINKQRLLQLEETNEQNRQRRFDHAEEEYLYGSPGYFSGVVSTENIFSASKLDYWNNLSHVDPEEER